MATGALDGFPMQVGEQLAQPKLVGDEGDRGSSRGVRAQNGQSAVLASVCVFSAHQKVGNPSAATASGEAARDVERRNRVRARLCRWPILPRTFSGRHRLTLLPASK